MEKYLGEKQQLWLNHWTIQSLYTYYFTEDSSSEQRLVTR